MVHNLEKIVLFLIKNCFLHMSVHLIAINGGFVLTKTEKKSFSL